MVVYLLFQKSSKNCHCTHQYLWRTFYCIWCPGRNQHQQRSPVYFNILPKLSQAMENSPPMLKWLGKVAVKTSRIIQENISPDATLNNNKVAAAILQYHNTPLEGINLSPEQILFHRQLRVATLLTQITTNYMLGRSTLQTPTTTART